MGIRLYKFADLDIEDKPTDDPKPVTIVQTMKTTLYVDEYGAVYTDRGGTLETLEPMYTYSTALDPDGDVIICGAGEGNWEKVKQERYS